MNTKEQNEEIADAKAGAVVVAESTAVSAEVAVQGAHLEFPFIRLAQGMSQWKTNGRKPVPGCWYISKNKDSNVLVAEGGKEAGIYGIILGVVEGFKEDRPYTPGNNSAPRRWVVGARKDDGNSATETDCLEAAAAEGYSLAPRPTGDVWPDSGRPVMRANLGRFCYLMMLVPLPEDFDSDEYRVYPIGDKLYTTARFEYDRQYYKQMSGILSNIRARAEFANRKNKDYKFTLEGLPCHLYSCDATSRSGIEYTTHAFEKALRNGKPWEYTKEEMDDLARFLLSLRTSVATVDDVEDPEF